MGKGGYWRRHRRRRCISCVLRRRRCEVDCIFAPLFPRGTESNFVRLRAAYGMARLTGILITVRPEFRNAAVTFMTLAREREDSSANGRRSRRRLQLANVVFLLVLAMQVPRLLWLLILLASLANQLRDLFRANLLQDPQDARRGGGREDRGGEANSSASSGRFRRRRN